LFIAAFNSYGKTLEKPYVSFKVEGKKIALTFDDGPNPNTTKGILSILKKYDVKATFFLIGKKIKKSPELLKLYPQDGHEVGNHSVNHPRLPELATKEDIRKEIEGNQELIASIIGAKPIAFRAPYLKFDDRVWEVLKENNLSAYNAARYLDCKVPDTIATHAKTAAKKVKPGVVILMHERPITLQFLDEFIKILKDDGYQFCTVSELKASSK
jgi:peptidoglycan/xylan/chitin deacetylase (PgdA/CDA1 family)